MKKITNWIFYPPIVGQSSILIIRFMAGGVFFGEGLLKFVYINQETKHSLIAGFPFSDISVYVFASMELIGGVLLILGLLTRVVTLCLIVQMIVLILCARMTLYIDMNSLPILAAPKTSIWIFFYEFRSDYAQLLCCLFLMVEGPGRRSLDFKLFTTYKIYTMKRV